MHLRLNRRLGPYRVVARLARGGSSDVYRAFDTLARDEVALKLPRRGDGERERGAFEREARAQARLAHPNVLPVRAAETIGEHFVIVTPLGVEDLASRLRRRLAPRTARALAEQLLSGLAHAHAAGVAHLDVKPQNAILLEPERLCVSDFGLARVLRRPRWASGSGTIGYLAPEQALGRPSLRSDVFSAGLVLWEMFGKHLPIWPFEWPLPGAARIERDFGPAVVAVLRRALAILERERPPDARALLAELRAALGGHAAEVHGAGATAVGARSAA